MRRLALRAVLIAGALDVVLTYGLMFAATIALSALTAIAGVPSGGDWELMTVLRIAVWLASLACGYLAARLAGHDALLNGTLAASGVFVIGLLTSHVWEGWSSGLLGLPLSPVPAFLGGLAWLLQQRAKAARGLAESTGPVA
ncbi:MAG TPA: hypothetical protein VMD91_07425 [Candidatus Sulfotelmatobacter sp.]|nr:hypothetical protein [Candidatus Sulfotelmatobacter sp.]